MRDVEPFDNGGNGMGEPCLAGMRGRYPCTVKLKDVAVIRHVPNLSPARHDCLSDGEGRVDPLSRAPKKISEGMNFSARNSQS